MFEFQFGDNALVVISVDIYAMVGVVVKVWVSAVGKKSVRQSTVRQKT